MSSLNKWPKLSHTTESAASGKGRREHKESTPLSEALVLSEGTHLLACIVVLEKKKTTGFCGQLEVSASLQPYINQWP
jgi:hypothetical protein